ncbi:MAG: hypothetical protein ACRD0J_06575 [Acidimicrobiales bacterium]
MICDPVGIPEVAKRAGLSVAAVRRWRYAELLPPERWTVGGGPAWDWGRDICPWLVSTGRLDKATGRPRRHPGGNRTGRPREPDQDPTS